VEKVSLEETIVYLIEKDQKIYKEVMEFINAIFWKRLLIVKWSLLWLMELGL